MSSKNNNNTIIINNNDDNNNSNDLTLGRAVYFSTPGIPPTIGGNPILPSNDGLLVHTPLHPSPTGVRTPHFMEGPD